MDQAQIKIEQTKLLKKSSCMIMPFSPYKQAWDMWIMVLLLYTATYVPFRVCFEDEGSDFLFWLDNIVDLGFFIDIIATFFTAIEVKGGSYDTSRTKIAWNYITGWFFIDLFTTIPF